MAQGWFFFEGFIIFNRFYSLGQAEIETATDQPFTYLSDYTKKKIRNLEKRKTKVRVLLNQIYPKFIFQLESYKNKLKSGEKLTPDQYEAGEFITKIFI